MAKRRVKGVAYEVSSHFLAHSMYAGAGGAGITTEMAADRVSLL